MQSGHAYCIHRKTAVLHKLSDTEGRLSFVNWYLHGVHDGDRPHNYCYMLENSWNSITLGITGFLC